MTKDIVVSGLIAKRAELAGVIDQIRETYRKNGNAGMWSAYVREHLLTRLFGLSNESSAAPPPKEEATLTGPGTSKKRTS